MAFILPLELNPIFARSDWNDFWTLHAQVARYSGLSVDESVAMYHIKQLPDGSKKSCHSLQKLFMEMVELLFLLLLNIMNLQDRPES